MNNGQIGTFENPIIDSSLNREDALKQNPAFLCPDEISQRQVLIDIVYWSFDAKYHKGQLIIDRDLAKDSKEIFAVLLKKKFPITSIIPIVHWRWKDEDSMQANNTSAFNYRYVIHTDRLSNHSNGQAIDLNPKINPCIGDSIEPAGAVYDPTNDGVITHDDFVVKLFKEKGWEWGGDWLHKKDYQHFQKIS